MFKRIFLFIAVNILVVLTISITLNVLGVRPYLDANGIDYGAVALGEPMGSQGWFPVNDVPFDKATYDR